MPPLQSKLIVVGIDARLALAGSPGWSSYAHGLLTALGSQPGVHLKVLFPDTGVAHALAESIAGTHVESHFEVFSTFSNDFYNSLPYQTDPALRLGQIDVFHSLTRFLPITPFRPLVATVHDVAPISDPPFKLEYRAATTRALRYLKESSAQIVAVSNFTRDELIARGGLSPSAIKVVYEGVNEALLQNFDSTPSVSSPYLLYVGGAGDNKNLPRLIGAVEQIQKNYPYRLYIAGAKEWGHLRFNSLYHQSKEWVSYLGFVDNRRLAALYRSASLVVVPSLHEGFGLPLIEAMAAGAPLACSDIPAFREVTGGWASFFDPKSEKAIVGSLWEMLSPNGRAKELAQKGVEHARGFRWTFVAEQMIGLYRELTQPKEVPAEPKKTRGAVKKPQSRQRLPSLT